MRLLLSFACNDPADGSCLNRFDQFRIEREDPWDETQLEGRPMVVRFHETTRYLQVGRRSFPAKGFATWVGNWCWDGARVDEKAGKQVVDYLLAKGFEYTVGPAE